MLKIKNYTITILSFLLFSNFFTYCLSRPEVLPLKPTYLIAMIVFATIIFLILFKKNNSLLYSKINIWVVFYIVILLFWFAFHDTLASLDELKKHFITILSISIFVAFLSFDNTKLHYARTGILLATMLSIFNNIYEFISPLAFFPLGSEGGVIGRSAGFNISPTLSGVILNFGLILSIELLDKKYRIYFSLLVFIAILLTFSRSAILGWVLIMLYMNVKGVISLKKTLLIFFISISLFLVSLPMILQYIDTTFGTKASANIINRFLWFLSPDDHVDYSQNERIEVAKAAWKMFTNNPIFGAGIEATRHWNLGVSTHNIFLKNIAEYGLIGFFIFPLFILSTIYKANKNIIVITAPFAIYMLFAGFFSHQLQINLVVLFSASLVSVLSYKSNTKYA